MKRKLFAFLVSAFFLAGYAQVTAPSGATTPQTSTAENPVWYGIMSSHLTESAMQNRWLSYNGSSFVTIQNANGLGSVSDVTQYAWRLVDNGDGYVRLVHYTGYEVYVPSGATAASGTENEALQMTGSGNGSRWNLMLAASTGLSNQTASNQYVLDYVDYTGSHDHAFLNAADSESSYALLIHEADVHQASGWFFVPVTVPDPTYSMTWEDPEHGLIDVGLYSNGAYVEKGTQLEAGTMLILTLVPDNGYELLQVMINDEDVTSSFTQWSTYSTYIFAMPSSDIVISATFVKKPKISWSVLGDGAVTVTVDNQSISNGSTISYGASFTATFTAEDGYEFVAATVNGSDVTEEAELNYSLGGTYNVTVTSVESDAEIFAMFTGDFGEWDHDETGVADKNGDSTPSLHPTEERYITSATTTGADINLDYSLDAAPDTFYINTGVCMQAKQGRSFDLNVTTSEDMKWCHGLIYIDWNGDGDFEDDNEFIAKIGVDASDADAPGDLLTVGNTEIVDFTRTIAIPKDAALGVTCMRLMFTDAWHNNNSHTHSATEPVCEGGIYDFYINITEFVARDFTITYEVVEGSDLGTVVLVNLDGYSEVESGTTFVEGTEFGLQVTPVDASTTVSITVNGDELNVEDYYNTDFGYYWYSFELNEDTHISVAMAEAVKTYYTLTYDVTGPESGGYYLLVQDMTDFDNNIPEIASGDQLEEGSEVLVQITPLYETIIISSVTVNDVAIDIDSYMETEDTLIPFFAYSFNIYEDTHIDIVITEDDGEDDGDGDGSGLSGSSADALKVYPTLFDSSITVELPADANVTVYSVSGAVVGKFNMSEGASTLDLGGLGKGMYLMKVESRAGTKVVQIVKK